MKIDLIDKRSGSLTPSSFTPEVLAALKDMPGRKSWQGRTLLFIPMDRAFLWIVKTFPEATWSDSAASLLSEANQREEGKKSSVLQVFSPGVFKGTELVFNQFKTTPYLHQMQALRISWDKEYFALFMEMGTGKSKVIIDTAAQLFKESKITQVIVLAPNGVHRKWVEKEIESHLHDDIPRRAIFWRGSGKRSEWEKVVEQARTDRSKLTFFCMNLDMLSQESCETLLKKTIKAGSTLLVIDESSRIKAISAKKTRLALRLAQDVQYRRILSGSPVTKNVEDLFTQFKFLHQEILGSPTLTEFRSRFCWRKEFEKQDGKKFERTVGIKNEAELQEAVSLFSFVAKKEDCLDLPAKIYDTITIELSPEQRRHYNNLVTKLRTEVEDGIVEVKTAIDSYIKMQQVICGFLRVEDGTIVELDASSRINAVRTIVEEAEGQVVIWCRFKHDVELLKNDLHSFGVVEYHGGVSNEYRSRNLADFSREGSDKKIFLGTPAAGGIGIDLVTASTVIYYSNSFDAEHRWQSEDRCHRIGQVNHVTYYDIVADKTIDKAILANLRGKKQLADRLIHSGLLSLLDYCD
jgi:hypothetical protein